MTPDQMRAANVTTAASAAGGGAAGVGKIDPEMRDLLVRQAAEAAAAQTGADIDAHNARIDLRQRHADEAKQLAAQLKPAAAAPAAPAHEKHHKGKGR